MSLFCIQIRHHFLPPFFAKHPESGWRYGIDHEIVGDILPVLENELNWYRVTQLVSNEIQCGFPSFPLELEVGQAESTSTRNAFRVAPKMVRSGGSGGRAMGECLACSP